MLKGLLFIGNVKPYYSWLHNAHIAVFLYPVYTAAAYGFWHLEKVKLKLVTGSFIAFQFLTVCFTSVNWDGRFLLPVLPLVFNLAGHGAFIYWNKLGKTN